MHPNDLQQLLLHSRYYGHPASQALSGPAQMSPADMQAMQQQMSMREYDAMMRSPQSIGQKKPTKKQLQDELLQGGSYNPFNVVGGFLGP